MSECISVDRVRYDEYQVEAIIRKLGGEKGVLSFLNDDTIITDRPNIKFTNEQKGKIVFSVSNNNRPDTRWNIRLMNKGIQLGRGIYNLLESQELYPKRIKQTKVIILDSNLGIFDEDESRITYNFLMRVENKLKLRIPTLEEICLICENISASDMVAMGFEKIVFMYPLKQPITLACCIPYYLHMTHNLQGRHFELSEASDRIMYLENYGFAFVPE